MWDMPRGPMKRETVKAATILSIGHDEMQELLEVEFRDGKVLLYHAVPEKVCLDFLRAKDKDTFFNTQIWLYYNATMQPRAEEDATFD